MKNGVIYAPTGVGNIYFNTENELVNYLPSTQTIAHLSPGTTLTIPRGRWTRHRFFILAYMTARIGRPRDERQDANATKSWADVPANQIGLISIVRAVLSTGPIRCHAPALAGAPRLTATCLA